MSAKSVLSQEIAYFEQILSGLLLAHAGKTVLIKGCEVKGIFYSHEKALTFAVTQGMNGPYLIRSIRLSQPDLGIPAISIALLQHLS